MVVPFLYFIFHFIPFSSVMQRLSSPFRGVLPRDGVVWLVDYLRQSQLEESGGVFKTLGVSGMRRWSNHLLVVEASIVVNANWCYIRLEIKSAVGNRCKSVLCFRGAFLKKGWRRIADCFLDILQPFAPKAVVTGGLAKRRKGSLSYAEGTKGWLKYKWCKGKKGGGKKGFHQD